MFFQDESGKIHSENLKFKVPSRKVRRDLFNIENQAKKDIDAKQKACNEIIVKLNDDFAKKYNFDESSILENDTREFVDLKKAEGLLVFQQLQELTDEPRRELEEYVEERNFQNIIETFIAITNVEDIKSKFVKTLFADAKNPEWDNQSLEEVTECISKFRKRLTT